MSTPRVSRLAEVLSADGIDAYIAQTPVSMGYLHGYDEDAHERFMVMAIRADGQLALICPALSATQARRTGIADIRTWKDGEDPAPLFAQLAEQWNLKSAILAVDDQMPAHTLLLMQSQLPAALFRRGQPVMSQLRRRKDDQELAAMREAARIADDTWLEVYPHLRAGQTEREVADMLVNCMKSRGGAPDFCIVASGAGGAEPHHLSDDTVLQNGDVVILDFGCSVLGYKSDITRTIAIGEATPKAQRVYGIVYQAFMAGRRAVQPGVTGASVDSAARQVIEESGFGEFFFHRLGHGIGCEGHEEPNLVSTNQQPLEATNTFSIEPGIYLAGEFGVRIENIVVTTEDGHESLNDEPSPEILVI